MMKKKISIKIGKNHLLLVACGVLTVLTVLTTISTAATGAEMSRLEKDEASLLDQRRSLQESMVKALSTRELEDKSTGLGFTKPSDIVYVSGLKTTANLP